jgi:regulator of protease activity HflC (stomatin/prohibitin superfamily)
MAIEVRCDCQHVIRARDELAGRVVKCPKCELLVKVPKPAARLEGPSAITLSVPRAHVPLAASMGHPSEEPHLAPHSVSIEQLLIGMFVAWGVLILATILTAMTSILRASVLALIAVLVTVAFLFLGFSLLRAKRRSLWFGHGDACFGFVRITSWDPTEGILFLKDKAVSFVDSNPNDGGGVRIIFPWMGEEEAFRAPLELQTTELADKDVLTKEYVPVDVKGTVYWRIVDLQRFYLFVSREVREVSERGQRRTISGHADGNDRRPRRSGTDRQLAAAEEWLRLMAEERTRAVLAQVRTGLLVADQVAADLPEGVRQQVEPEQTGSVASPGTTHGYRNATDGLAASIFEVIAPAVSEYGIEVHRVALQEVRLRPEIHQAAVAACVTAYDPLKAQRAATVKTLDLEATAAGRRMLLEGEADVIGSDAVAKREVVGSVQPYAFGNRYGGFVDFLTKHFERGAAITGPDSSDGLFVTQPSPKTPARRSKRGTDVAVVSSEETAKSLLNDARVHYESGQTKEAAALLAQIVDAYPETRAAEYARQNLDRLSRP